MDLQQQVSSMSTWIWFKCMACGRTMKRAAMASVCLHCRGRLERTNDPEKFPEPGSAAWLEQRALTALIVRS